MRDQAWQKLGKAKRLGQLPVSGVDAFCCKLFEIAEPLAWIIDGLTGSLAIPKHQYPRPS